MPEQPNEDRQSALGRLLFSFFVVADTHVNESENASTSPYRTNLEANPRARQVFAEMAAVRPRPRFVVHLGDMVHPVPALPEQRTAIEQFRSISSQLPSPLRATPGNHDVGDKLIEWMPAGRVCEEYLATYRKAFGPDYYGFEEDGVLFIVLNSLLLNSGLPDEARQRAWVERELDRAVGGRVFLFMHYPPFLHSPDESGNYDNIDEPARTWLLDQIGRREVEAAFSGHVHNFWLHSWGSAKLYALPSTAFVRQDFAEFCASDPGPEFGRNDVGKLGYFKVDIFEDGHVANLVRSWGRTCAPKQIPEGWYGTADRTSLHIRIQFVRRRAPPSLGGGRPDTFDRGRAGIRPQEGAERLYRCSRSWKWARSFPRCRTPTLLDLLNSRPHAPHGGTRPPLHRDVARRSERRTCVGSDGSRRPSVCAWR